MKPSREDITVIIEKNKNLIFKVVNAYCYYPEEQEDLIQEIIIHLLKSYKRFDYGVQITTWIYKIAFNVVISYNRKIKTREKYFVPLKEKFVHIQDENKVEDDENLKKLNHFIAQLKPLHKALMIKKLKIMSIL